MTCTDATSNVTRLLRIMIMRTKSWHYCHVNNVGTSGATHHDTKGATHVELPKLCDFEGFTGSAGPESHSQG